MGNSSTKDVNKYRKLGYAEVFAGRMDEFEDNTNFKEVNIVSDFSVLVAKIAGKFYCIGSKCPHRGGPLGEGVYDDGRIFCPWHGACFDFESGDIEEFPGVDCVQTYPVKTKHGDVYVYIDNKNIQMQITKPMIKLSDCYTRMVIIGGGAAGYTCAQTLRQEGYNGVVTIITQEPYLPYDKTELSKNIDSKWKDIKLRGKEFYMENDIEVKLSTEVSHVNFLEHKIYIRGNDTYVSYDSLFIAIGNKPRALANSAQKVKSNGFNLKNIVSLHNMADAKYIADNITGRKLLIVGSSFLAMELASSLLDKCLSIDILSRHKGPYKVILGRKIGKIIFHYLQETTSKIVFHQSTDVKCFNSNGKGEVVSCTTIKKEIIPCDFVILANGAVPNTTAFANSKLILDKKTGAVLVNKFMETNIKHTFAGGDCCRFPISCAAQNSATIEHWQVAQTHGRVAALNMLGTKVSISDIIPFYYTTCGDLIIKYCGHGQSYDEMLVFGSITEWDHPEFCAVYRRGKKIIAACAINCDSLITEISVQLQKQSEWTTEFPECLTKRFPLQPIKISTSFGIREDLEHDLIKSDLEVAFMHALSYDRVETVAEQFIPTKFNVLDTVEDAEFKNVNALDKTEEERIEFLKQQHENRENLILTLGPYIKLPLTEFGEDTGIPKMPTHYIDTRKYLASVNAQFAATDITLPTTPVEQKRSKEDSGRKSSRHSPRIMSVPKLLKTIPGRRSTAKSLIQIKVSNEEVVNKPGGSQLETPRQILKARKSRSLINVTPTRSESPQQRISAEEAGKVKMKSSAEQTGGTSPQRISFRSELAGMTGKPHLNPRALRPVKSFVMLQEVETEVIIPKHNRIGVVNVFPEREPLPLDPSDYGTQKKMLIPQTLTASVEKVVGLQGPSFLSQSHSSKSHIKKEETTTNKGVKIEDKEYLHETPDYARLGTANTTQIAKLIIKQYPEISRARAHLNMTTPPVLEVYPNKNLPSINVGPTKSGGVLDVLGTNHTFVKRINYDFEKSNK